MVDRRENFEMILGIDEVGRGPYAGPLVIGACILPSSDVVQKDEDRYAWIRELTDSKKLGIRKRELLYEKIKHMAPASTTGWVTSREIDRFGISESLKLACRRAVEQIQKTKIPFSEIVIDGTVNFLIDTTLEKYVSTLKRGDFLIKEISAASIIAKVERDRYMVELAKKYPGYGFDRHVGYGTKNHQEAMEKFGLTTEHRRSFRPVREIEEKSSKSFDVDCKTSATNRTDLLEKDIDTTKIGKHGEEIVVNFLKTHRHKIIARNFKTKFYEIDIISRKDNFLIFTEVKYRKNTTFGDPLDFIDKKKRKQMKFAVESFLAQHKEFQKFIPKLAVGSVTKENFELEKWFILEE